MKVVEPPAELALEDALAGRVRARVITGYSIYSHGIERRALKGKLAEMGVPFRSATDQSLDVRDGKLESRNDILGYFGSYSDGTVIEFLWSPDGR